MLFALIVALCIVDSITTWYTVKSGAGYEANTAISAVVNETWFYALKLIVTVLVLYGISILCRSNKRLKSTSYLSLVVFYGVVVANNVSVILMGVDFGFNLSKLFTLFGAIFASIAAGNSKISAVLYRNL